jgi:sugar/nucleoside kinase (ribokinase family)
VVTSCEDSLSLDGFFPGNVQISRTPATATTTFRNEILVDGGREQYVSAKAERLDVEHVPFNWLDTQILLAAPVLDEVDPTMLGRFRRSLIGAVGQGWLRRWSGAADTALGRADLSAIEAIPPVGAFFVSDEDFEGGLSDLAEVLEGLTPIAVVTHGAAGADLFWNGEWLPIRAFRAREADPTGAGDVFAAAFLVRLSETRDPVVAARFASAAASLSVESIGPLDSTPSREDVERRIEAGER